MQRLLPQMDLHFTNCVCIYTEFQFDYIDFRNGGPRPGMVEDRGDVHQLYLARKSGLNFEYKNGKSLRTRRVELSERQPTAQIAGTV
jgi:hypothetical protein